MGSFRLFVCMTVLTAVCFSVPAAARKRLTVGLRFLVAQCPSSGQSDGDGLEPVKTRAWVESQVEAAQQLFESHGVHLVSRVESFEPKRCVLIGRAQRNALAAHVRMDGDVTVVLVRRIRDLDMPSYNLMGVHWRYGGKRTELRGRRWVYLTSRAKPPVLAHELAHYFGIRHDPKGGNLMTPGPSSPLWKRKGPKPAPFQPHFTADQAIALRAGVRRFTRRHQKSSTANPP